MEYKKKSYLGFTLIELLVAFTATALLSTIGFAAFVSYQRNQVIGQAVAELRNNLAFAKAKAQIQEVPDNCSDPGWGLYGYKVIFTETNYEIKAVCDNPPPTPRSEVPFPCREQLTCTVQFPSGVRKKQGPNWFLFPVLRGSVLSNTQADTSGKWDIVLDHNGRQRAIAVTTSGGLSAFAPTPIPTLSPTPTSVPSLVLVGSASLENRPVSVFVSGNYAYVLAGGILYKFDVSQNNPVLVGSVSTGGGSKVFVSGNYAYVVTSSSPASLKKFDISSNTPVLVGSAGTTGIDPQSVFVSGNYAYVVTFSPASLKKFDISSNTPVLVGSATTGSAPQSVFVSGDYAYVVNYSAGTLQKFNISSNTPSLVGSVPVGTAGRSVFVSGNYAYIVGLGQGIKKVDVTSNTPVVVGNATTGGDPQSVFVSGNYAYVTNPNDSLLQKFDVSSNTPILVARSATNSGPYSVYGSGGYIYVVNYNAKTLQKFRE